MLTPRSVVARGHCQRLNTALPSPRPGFALVELFLCHPERSEGTRILPRPLFHGRGGRPPGGRVVRVLSPPPALFCVILERSEESRIFLCRVPVAPPGQGEADASRRASGAGPNSKLPFPAHSFFPSSRPPPTDPRISSESSLLIPSPCVGRGFKWGEGHLCGANVRCAAHRARIAGARPCKNMTLSGSDFGRLGFRPTKFGLGG
jgi:hypothetical protein